MKLRATIMNVLRRIFYSDEWVTDVPDVHDLVLKFKKYEVACEQAYLK